MKNQKGFVPFFAVIIIAIIAGSLVAVAWWYNKETEQRDALTNTAEQFLNTAQNTNVAANTNTATNTNVQTNTNTSTNTNSETTTTDMSSLTPGCPTWQVYTDTEYGWTMDYPCDWTYDYTYNATGNDPFVTYPERYVKFIDPTGEYRLFVGLLQNGDAGSTIVRTGVGAGEFVSQDPVTVAGVPVPVRHLVYETKLKEVMFYQSGSVSVGDFALTSTFDQNQDVVAYDDIDLEGTNELAIGTAILESLTLP